MVVPTALRVASRTALEAAVKAARKPLFIGGTRNASTWSMRAWLTLREAGLEFEEAEIDLRRPQRDSGLAALAAFSPARSVPILIADGAAIFDSLAIMEFANEQCGGALLPRSARARIQARSVLAWQHGGLSGLCGGISFESAFYAERPALSVSEAGELARLFEALEAMLDSSGGPYLFGEVSLADLGLVPTLVRLLARSPSLARWPRAAGWTQRLQQRPAVLEWMGAARSLTPVHP